MGQQERRTGRPSGPAGGLAEARPLPSRRPSGSRPSRRPGRAEAGRRWPRHVRRERRIHTAPGAQIPSIQIVVTGRPIAKRRNLIARKGDDRHFLHSDIWALLLRPRQAGRKARTLSLIVVWPVRALRSARFATISIMIGPIDLWQFVIVVSAAAAPVCWTRQWERSAAAVGAQADSSKSTRGQVRLASRRPGAPSRGPARPFERTKFLDASPENGEFRMR